MRKHLAWLLVLALLIPTFAGGTGSLSIPNTLANLAAGAQPLSVIDTNFSTIATYINAREITAGVCASRPAASVSGRFYLCTDTAGGTLYFDTGSTWTQVAGGVQPAASPYGIRGLVAGTASLTVVNASATLVNLRNPSDGSVVVQTATVTVSNSLLATGSVVNGRDQVAQFSASSWVHVYYIWNGTTLGSLSSACAPSDVNGACSSSFGPNLPTAYTHWAYIGAWRYNASSNLVAMDQRGPWGYYRASQSAVNGGAASASETRVNVPTLVPPNAQEVRYNIRRIGVLSDGGGSANATFTWRVVSGSIVAARDVVIVIGATNNAFINGGELVLPNVNQEFFYTALVSAGSAPNTTMDVTSYRVPNGAE